MKESLLSQNKLYYSITEVSGAFDVNASLLRFWEKKFPQIQPKKNKKGKRYYSPENIELIDQIYHLVKERGYTLEGAERIIAKGGVENLGLTEIIQKLETIKNEIIELKNTL